jgi:hypothetical protein
MRAVLTLIGPAALSLLIMLVLLKEEDYFIPY